MVLLGMEVLKSYDYMVRARRMTDRMGNEIHAIYGYSIKKVKFVLLQTLNL